MTNQIKDASPIIILQNQIALLKLKTRNCLQISEGGGLFNITPDLIAYLHFYLNHHTYGYGKPVSMILLDKNDNPIKIDDVESLLRKMLERDQEVMNDYYVEFEKLKVLKSSVEWLDD